MGNTRQSAAKSTSTKGRAVAAFRDLPACCANRTERNSPQLTSRLARAAANNNNCRKRPRAMHIVGHQHRHPGSVRTGEGYHSRIWVVAAPMLVILGEGKRRARRIIRVWEMVLFLLSAEEEKNAPREKAAAGRKQ